MKKYQNISVRASALKITLAVALVSISSILLAPTSKAAPAISQPSQSCGRIDTADAVAALQHLFGNNTLTGCELTAADVTGDSSVNTVDAIGIQRFYAGFTSGTGTTGTDAGCGRCHGDPASSTNSPLPAVTVSLPNANFDPSVDSSTVIVVPVVTTTIDSSMGLVGFQGDFTFDERVVTFNSSVPAQKAGLTSANGWAIVGHVLTGAGPFRTLRISAWFPDGVTPISGSGTLFNLRMLRVSSTPGDMSNLVWTSSPDDFEFVDSTRNTRSPQQTNGLITITGPTPTPEPPLPTPTPTAAPTAGPSTPTPPPLGCGPIDIADAIAVDQHFFGSSPLTGCALTAGDATGSSGVNFQDALAISRFYTGFTSGIGSVTGTDAGCGRCYGDPVTSTNSPLPEVTVSLPTATLDTSVDISTIIIQPVVATTIASSSGLVGFQGNFTFDERVVTFNPGQPVLTAALTSLNGWTIWGHILPGAGPFRTLRVAAFYVDGVTPISGSGALFNLRMIRVSSTPGDMSNLVWLNSPDDFKFVDSTKNTRSPQQTNGQVIITPIPEPPSPTPPPTPTITPPPSPTPTPGPLVCGRIDTPDAVAAQRYFLGNPFLTGCPLTAADCAGSSSINTQDVLAIQRFYLGFTSGTGRAGTDTGCGRCYGDVFSSTNSTLAGVTVSLPTASLDTSVDPSTVILLPVVTTMLPGSPGIVGFQGDFTFDERVVTLSPSVPVQKAGLTSGTNPWTVDGHILPGAGPFRTLRVSGFALDTTTPISGSGTLFELKMLRVSSTPGDMSNLVWIASPDDFEFVDTTLNLLSPSQTNGLITITGPTPTPDPSTPTPTPPSTPAPPTVIISGRVGNCSSPAPTATPPASPTPANLPGVPNVLMTLTGSSSGTTLTDASGNYSFTVATGGSYTVTASKGPLAPGTPGIQTTDIVAIQRHYLGVLAIPAGCRRMAADVLVDGVINTSDVICPQKFFQGFAANIGSCGQYKFTPAIQSYPLIATNQTGQDYAMYVIGDVAPAFVNRPAEGSLDALEENELTYSNVTSVNLPEITANHSSRDFTAAVTSSLINTKENLVGFQGDFTFDERVVTFANEPVQAAGLTANNWNVSGNVLPGKGPIRTLRISAYSTDFVPLSGVGTLFDLKIAQVNSGAGSSPLMWAAPPDNFIFINGDLVSQKPGNTSPGSVGAIQRR